MHNICDIFKVNATTRKLEYLNSSLILSKKFTADIKSNTTSALTMKQVNGAQINTLKTMWCRLQLNNTVVWGTVSNIQYDDTDSTIMTCVFSYGINKSSLWVTQITADTMTSTTGKYTNLVQYLNNSITTYREQFGFLDAPIQFVGGIRPVVLKMAEDETAKTGSSSEFVWMKGSISIDEVLKQLMIAYGIVPTITYSNGLLNVGFTEIGYTTYTNLNINVYPVVSRTKTIFDIGFGMYYIFIPNTGAIGRFKLGVDGAVYRWTGNFMDNEETENMETGQLTSNWSTIEPYVATLSVKGLTNTEFAGESVDVVRTLREAWANHTITTTIDDNNIQKYLNLLGQNYNLYDKGREIKSKLTSVSQDDDGLITLTFGYARKTLTDELRYLKEGYSWR